MGAQEADFRRLRVLDDEHGDGPNHTDNERQSDLLPARHPTAVRLLHLELVGHPASSWRIRRTALLALIPLARNVAPMAEQQVSVERLIDAPAQKIFDLLADPAGHALIDGSGTVLGHRGQQTRLALGSTFGMNMRVGVPYRMKNRVMEFEENRLIAWCHFFGHRWRYELQEEEAGTLVRETFDWSTARIPAVIAIAGYPKRHPAAMEATLAKIAELVETPR